MVAGGAGRSIRTLGGRYQLDRRIGVGGMSEVWRAHDPVLDRPVAVKLMTPVHAADAGGVDAYALIRAEARTVARLSHPNIAGVHDFGTVPVTPGRPAPYIVMELLEGRTLGALLTAGPLDWRIAVRICAEVSAALAAAHGNGIVHRDVKPANVMLTAAGVKVLDFGIAAVLDRADDEPDGKVVGTPAFVPPERFAGAPATPATDTYALGVMLYLSLTGCLPWPVPGGEAVAQPRPDPDPVPLRTVPDLPPTVVDLCLRCLSRDPADRPTSYLAALLLADEVDAQVYVPIAAAVRPLSGSPAMMPAWDERAASAPTGLLLANPSDEPPDARPGAGAEGSAGVGVGARPGVGAEGSADVIVGARLGVAAERPPGVVVEARPEAGAEGLADMVLEVRPEVGAESRAGLGAGVRAEAAAEPLARPGSEARVEVGVGAAPAAEAGGGGGQPGRR
ncbi:serine/threonine-protein kinase [Rhizomonospora bruguierae]|uniref:serine/threonine-protein kinase n=1 Tax=Rhizomonospora bruguierae TaxID=1581705 RepID=UPI00278C6B4A|nr:serine/threonine-protein kinase [Micromonospora sp. NBRC 107566]